MKADVIVTSIHSNVATLFVVRLFLSAKMYPETQGFGTQKKSPFTLNRDVPSINRYNDYVNIFSAPNFVPSVWRFPSA